MPIAVASASCADGVILELGDSERVMIRSLWNLRNETYQTRETCVGPRGATSSTSQTARPPAPSEVDAISATTAIDMLNGPLPGKILRFAIPLALSSILQQLLNSADASIAGQFVSSFSLAGIGGVNPVTACS